MTKIYIQNRLFKKKRILKFDTKEAIFKVNKRSEEISHQRSYVNGKQAP
jgi:hypothetical protein